MTQEEIYKKIETVYSSEKGRGFIIHLLRSFFPVHKSYYMWEPIAGAKCCITGIPLCSKDEVMKAFTDVASEQIKFTTGKILGEVKSNEESPLKKAIGGKLLGIKTDRSEKLICQEVLQGLLTFYNTNLPKDNHLKWVAKDERKKEYQKNVPKSDPLPFKPATTNLGDILREKLSKEKPKD